MAEHKCLHGCGWQNINEHFDFDCLESASKDFDNGIYASLGFDGVGIAYSDVDGGTLMNILSLP